MDFNIKKPLHILALLLISVSFFIIIILPIFSFVGMFPTTQSIEFEQLSESLRLMSEIFILIFQLALVFVLLVLIPVLWYILVNETSIKDSFSRMKLRLQNIDMAFLWGILAAGLIFVVIFAIELLFIGMGHSAEDLSNIPDIQQLFSWPTLFFLVAFQPIGEEIFFRGFLFEKIEGYAGGYIAIFITAFLFGLAHMSYGKIFPVLMPILMGVVLGFIVLKTKNLYSAIVAHIAFNVTSLTLAYLGWSLIEDAALIL